MAGALGSCLLSLGQERVPLGLELGWDPGGQPPFPSAAPGVTAQGSNLLVLLGLIQSRQAALAKSIGLRGVSERAWVANSSAS